MLLQLQKKLIELEKEIASEQKEYNLKLRKLYDNKLELKAEIGLYKKSLDVDKIKLAETLIKCKHEPSTSEARIECVGSAIEDFTKEEMVLTKKYFGVKYYSGFGEQRSDHFYRYVPTHGSIVFSIKLLKKDVKLTDEEREACLYYLYNLEAIYEANKI